MHGYHSTFFDIQLRFCDWKKHRERAADRQFALNADLAAAKLNDSFCYG
jgi:hypothetical protein